MTAPPTYAILDLHELRAITGEDTALMQQLGGLFLDTLTRCEQQLQQALATQDARLWQESAHELKGAALNMAAGPLSRLCDQAEHGPPDAARLAEITHAVATLQALLPQLLSSPH